MKTNRIFIMALACIAAVSCVKENAPEQTSGLVSFIAEKETFGDQTKAVLVDGRRLSGRQVMRLLYLTVQHHISSLLQQMVQGLSLLPPAQL